MLQGVGHTPDLGSCSAACSGILHNQVVNSEILRLPIPLLCSFFLKDGKRHCESVLTSSFLVSIIQMPNKQVMLGELKRFQAPFLQLNAAVLTALPGSFLFLEIFQVNANNRSYLEYEISIHYPKNEREKKRRDKDMTVTHISNSHISYKNLCQLV